MNPALTAEIQRIADELTGADPDLDLLIEAAIGLHHTDPKAPKLATILTRLTGEISVLRLLALVIESKADAQPVQDLTGIDRHATKAALHTIAADLDRIAITNHAAEAAIRLTPA